MEPFIQVLLGTLGFALFLVAVAIWGTDSRPNLDDRTTPRWI